MRCMAAYRPRVTGSSPVKPGGKATFESLTGRVSFEIKGSMEGWPSGLRRCIGNAVGVTIPLAGSNPAPSAIFQATVNGRCKCSFGGVPETIPWPGLGLIQQHGENAPVEDSR